MISPILLIGRYSYSHWVLGMRPGGIESYRLLPQLGVVPCDHGSKEGSPWLLRFVTDSEVSESSNDDPLLTNCLKMDSAGQGTATTFGLAHFCKHSEQPFPSRVELPNKQGQIVCM